MDILLYTLLAIIIIILLPRNIAKWILVIVVTLVIIGAVIFLILAFVPSDFDWSFLVWVVLLSGIILPTLKWIDKMREKKDTPTPN